MTIIKSQVELTSKESRQLWYRLIAVAVFFVISLVVFGLIFFNGGFVLQDVTTYVFGGFGLFFYGIIGYIAWGFAADLFRGEKLVIRGVVTDKRRHKSRNSGRRGRGGKSSSRPKYYLFFGEEKYYVDQKHYSQVNVGEEVEMHYAPKSSTSLSIKSFSNAESIVTESSPYSIKDLLNKRKENVAALQKKELLMSDHELSLLRKYRNRLIIKNVWLAFFFGFIALAFTIGGLLWWVMFIPSVLLWIGVFALIRGVFRHKSNYREEERSSMKLVVLTRILDKQHHTGSSNDYRIVTDLGSYVVPAETYHKLDGQQPVFVSIGKHSGWLIDIISKSE